MNLTSYETSEIQYEIIIIKSKIVFLFFNDVLCSSTASEKLNETFFMYC